MTISNSIPADAVLVAIDIATVRNEVLIEAPGDKRRRWLPILNNRAEHDRLIEVLLAYGRPVVCGFEATGNHYSPIAWRLAETGFEVRLVSSLALARNREALHNSGDKNDPLSERTWPGTPRRMNRSDRASMTLVELSLRSMRIARHSRVNSSMMLSMRNFLPSWVRPSTKS